MGSSTHAFYGFNGIAGVWRINALNEAGGWKDRTIVEDIDLVVKAWHLHIVHLFPLVEHLVYIMICHIQEHLQYLMTMVHMSLQVVHTGLYTPLSYAHGAVIGTGVGYGAAPLMDGYGMGMPIGRSAMGLRLGAFPEENGSRK